MTFYNRNGILYIRLKGRRVSTKLTDTPTNRKLVKSYHKNDEFFHNLGIVTKGIPTVVELCERVLLEKEKIVKNTTYIAYSSLLNSRIKPFFEKRLITTIKKRDVLKFFNTFNDK